MRTVLPAVGVILMTLGLGILGYVNATVGVICLFGGAALWLISRKETIFLIERAIASKSRREALDEKSAKKKHIREQFAKLSPAEKEAVKHVRLNGHILPQQVAAHLTAQGFTECGGVIDSVRGKTPFLLGSFSGEFSINPELKDLLDDLLSPPLLGPLARGLALFLIAFLVLGSGYLFRRYVYHSEPTVPTASPAQPNDQHLEKPKEPEPPEAKPIPAAKPPKRASISRANQIPLPSQKPSVSQECAPGANCAVSNGQQGGITAGQINIGPPPMEIKFSAEAVPSTKSDFPYETKVTIFTTVAYTPVSLAVVCNVALAPDVTFDFGPNGSALFSPSSGLSLEDNKVALVRFGGTAISEDTPLYVHLWSKEPLQVLKVVQAKIKQRPS